LKSIGRVGRIITKLSALVHFGTRKKSASSFGVKRSKFTVIVDSGFNVLENALFGLVNVI